LGEEKGLLYCKIEVCHCEEGRQMRPDVAIPQTLPETIGDRHTSVSTGSR